MERFRKVIANVEIIASCDNACKPGVNEYLSNLADAGDIPISSSLEVEFATFSEAEIGSLIPQRLKSCKEDNSPQTWSESGVQWHYVSGRSLLRIEPANGKARGWVVDPADRDRVLIAEMLMPTAVLGLLRENGYFSLHASCASKDGRGVIFTAPPENGKTSCALSMVEGGFDFIADENPLIKNEDGRITVYSIEAHLRAPAKVASWLPKMRQFFPNGKRSKTLIDVDSVWPGRRANSCEPGMIVFPKIAGTGPNLIEPRKKVEALTLVIDQSLGRLKGSVGMSQFAVIADLVERCDCYNLVLGENPEELPSLIESALALRRRARKNKTSRPNPVRHAVCLPQINIDRQ
jgi:hypothetical protein